MAQISRIEAGGVAAPTAETLTSLAVALGRDPELLLLAAGKIDRPTGGSLVKRIWRDHGGDKALIALANEMEELHGNIRRLQLEHATLLRDLQSLADEQDHLNLALTEQFGALAQIEGAHAARRRAKPDPEIDKAIAAKSVEVHRLEAALAEVDARTTRLKDDLKSNETQSMGDQRRLTRTLREAAGRMFVSGAVVPLHVIPDGDDAGDSDDTRALHQLAALVSAEREIAVDRVRRAKRESSATEQVSKALEVAIKRLDEIRAEAEYEAKLSARRRPHFDQLFDDEHFRQLAASWNRLSPDRRVKVLNFVEDQRLLSVQEQLAKPEEVKAIERPRLRR